MKRFLYILFFVLIACSSDLEKCKQQAEKEKDVVKRDSLYIEVAKAFYQAQNLDSMYQYATQVLKDEKLFIGERRRIIIAAERMIGEYHRLRLDFENAKKYHNLSLKDAEAIKDTLSIIMAYSNLASAESDNDNVSGAIPLFLRADSLLKSWKNCPPKFVERRKMVQKTISMNLALNYGYVGMFDKASLYFSQDSLFSEDPTLQLQAKYSKGLFYASVGAEDFAYKSFTEGLEQAEEQNLSNFIIMFNTAIGTLSPPQETQDTTAISYFRKAYTFAQKNGLNEMASEPLISLAEVFSYQGKKDSALFYYKIATPFAQKSPEQKLNLYSNLVSHHLRFQEVSLAQKYIDTLSVKAQYQTAIMQSKCDLAIASYYKAINQTDSAIIYNKKVASLLEKDSLSPILAESYIMLEELYKNKKDTIKAFYYLNAYQKNNILRGNYRKNLQKVREAFALKRQEEKAATKRKWLFTFLALCMLIITFLSYFYYQKNKMAQAQATIAQKERENAQVQVLIAQKERENAQAQAQIAQKERENAQVQAQIAQKERENALLQTEIAEKEQEKAQFLKKVSHEIGNAISTIVNANALLQKIALPDTAYNASFSIYNASQRLARYLQDIKATDKEGNPLEFDLFNDPFYLQREIIAPLYMAFGLEAEKKNITFTLKTATNTPSLFWGDPLRIYQILENLLKNAIKFTPKNGTVNLFISQNDKQEICFAVSDSGIGIDIEEQKQLFQPKGQTKAGKLAGGMGLGLYNSKRLANLMKGDISLQSEHDKGSIFSLHLPLKNASHTEMRAFFDKNNMEGILLGTSILLVDDEDEVRKGNATMLERNIPDAQITTASDGTEAIEILQNQTFDIILIDINMKIMGGIAASKKIREMNIKTPIIALTGSADTNEIVKFRDAGINDYMDKAFYQPYKLLEKIKNNINSLRTINMEENNEILLADIVEDDIEMQYLKNLTQGDIAEQKSQIFDFLTSLEKEKTDIQQACQSQNLTLLNRRVHNFKYELKKYGLLIAAKEAEKIEMFAKFNQFDIMLETLWEEVAKGETRLKSKV